MRIVNLSHGSYFLLGGYVALSVIGTTGSWLLSIPIATLTIAVVGLIMERLFLRPEGHARLVRDALIALGIALVIRLMIGPILPQLLPGQIGGIIQVTLVVIVFAIPIFLLLQRISAIAIEADVLRQVLMTVGFAFLFQQAALDIWGGNNFDIQPPARVDAKPRYRWHLSAALPAVHDRRGPRHWYRAVAGDGKDADGCLSARYRRRRADGARRRHRHQHDISMLIFALGAGMAALGGVIGGAFLGVYPGLDFEMLPIAFAVVIIGGMGSLGGARDRRVARRSRRQFRQGPVSRVGLLHALCADGADPRDQADRPLRTVTDGTWCTQNFKIAAVIVSLLVLLIIVPYCNSFVILLATRAMVFAILAMSLDILLGFTGLASLGQAAYFGSAPISPPFSPTITASG